jgi:maltooligosyltrehalose trehalohydrolase
VGNRAQGERLCHLVGLGRQKIAAALVLASPFIPMLFQGEEFGASSPFQYFSQHEDADLGQKVSEGRKTEFAAFGWNPEEIPDPQDREAFDRSKLPWSETNQGQHAELLDWYKQLIALRRSSPDLTDGRLTEVHVAFDERAQWLTLKRGDIEVVCNLSGDRQAIPITRMPRGVLASNDRWDLRPGLIEIAGDSVAVLSPKAFAFMQEHFRQYASA